MQLACGETKAKIATTRLFLITYSEHLLMSKLHERVHFYSTVIFLKKACLLQKAAISIQECEHSEQIGKKKSSFF
jgi:hypothetical protein